MWDIFTDWMPWLWGYLWFGAKLFVVLFGATCVYTVLGSFFVGLTTRIELKVFKVNPGQDAQIVFLVLWPFVTLAVLIASAVAITALTTHKILRIPAKILYDAGASIPAAVEKMTTGETCDSKALVRTRTMDYTRPRSLFDDE